ncbi:MAG: hypothetical protein IPM04_13005 [Saprospiraceae bacterium]|nr:hypothetical protein [Candidatus Brachybacter algidus]MBK8748741.1 hypothetical protein [Candidatus Brachybacter algidus]
MAIKIFGENLDSLVTYVNKVAKVIGSIEGVPNLRLKRVDGLPQIAN